MSHATPPGQEPGLPQTPQHSPQVITSEEIDISVREGEPKLGIPDRRLIKIKLATQESETNCSFWVGLARAGTITPSTLLDQPDVPTVLTLASGPGISEEGPIMLSDSSFTPPRFVYLLPIPDDEFRSKAIWVESLVSTIKSWSPHTVGFYLSPEMVAAAGSQELLLMIIRDLILTSETSDFYLLVGAHGLNTILNTALALKEEIEDTTLNLMVYH